MKLTYLIIPIISGIIGWGTNRLAVYMLFHPYQPIRLFFFDIHGLIPRRQKELAVSISETVERELISHKDIEAIVSSPEVTAAILTLIENEIETFLKSKLSMLPGLSLLMDNEISQTIKKLHLSYLQEQIPALLTQVMGKLEDGLDFKAIVREKIEAYDFHELEALIYELASKELKAIEILGAVLGFLIGLVQVGLLLFSESGLII